jgi:methylenetetrahydrofolate reductase (NADPH)
MFREALKSGEFVVTCEFVPGRGKEGKAVDAAVGFAEEVSNGAVKVHAISITDQPGGNPAITPDIIGRDVQDKGVDALVHISCRDLNRNAIEARAMALSRAGINSVLVITGDYPDQGFEGHAAPVFDLGSVQGIKYLKEMNKGIEYPGMKKGSVIKLPETDFTVAAGVNPFKYTEREMLPQLFKLERKVVAGADLIIPQLGYDMRKFHEVRRYMSARNLKVPMLGNVYVLSYGAAKAMSAGAVPGCVVPKQLLDRLAEEAKSEDKGRRARMERAARMVAIFKGMGFNGVHIGGFALKTADFKFIIEEGLNMADKWEELVPEFIFDDTEQFYAYPAPESYAKFDNEKDAIDQPTPSHASFSYGMSLMMHHMMFEPGSLGCKFMQGYYNAIKGKKCISKVAHCFEEMAKIPLFGCQDCGDCALSEMAYRCPQSGCAKQQRNGPCGGSTNGMCEVYPDDKKCVWTIVYERLKRGGRLEDMRSKYMPPRMNELEFTSAWANYFTGADHQKLPGKKAAEKQD